MPAGSKTTPTETTFTLRVRGDYTSAVEKGTGVGRIIVPADVPSACSRDKGGRVDLQPRLVLTKLSDSGEYFVEKGDEYTYLINVENRGIDDANGVSIIDIMPKDRGNFSYVTGNATLDGSPREPDSVTNGPDGTVIWNNIYIPAGGAVQLRYRMYVDGLEFYELCNTAEAKLNAEKIAYGSRRVCVKINPPIDLDKTVDQSTAQPGSEVRFTLKLTNNASQSYEVGLYDVLGKFEYVRQESGYAQPNPKGKVVEWPLTPLSPGESLNAVIIARVPNECTTTTYVNELRFFFRSEGQTYIVRQIPAEVAKVQVNCGTNRIEYRKSADRGEISLQDRVVYTLSIKNVNTIDTINNITVVDILPQGFTYVGMDGRSGITTLPRQEDRADGRVKLTWTIPSLQANRSTNIVFVTRSGDIVGSFENWLSATAPNLLEARCRSNCKTVEDEGEVVTYSTSTVDVEPLHTMEPLITDDSCAIPGDTRTYRLSLVNTNNHSYTKTDVTLKLPFGLRYNRALNLTPLPSVLMNDMGESSITWSNLTVPAKPRDQSAALVVLEIELEVGQIWEDRATQVQVNSPDGAIPRKDGVFDPIVKMCVDEPAIAKEASHKFIDKNDQMLYQISIVNPTESEMTVTVEDILHENFQYMSKVSGAEPALNGNTLTWADVKVPAATAEDGPGILNLQFKVRPTAGEEGEVYTNTATVVNASPSALNTDYNSVDVTIAEFTYLYLPVIRR
jgi:uncharacterized repeat protein (TIGR01451 family)